MISGCSCSLSLFSSLFSGAELAGGKLMVRQKQQQQPRKEEGSERAREGALLKYGFCADFHCRCFLPHLSREVSRWEAAKCIDESHFRISRENITSKTIFVELSFPVKPLDVEVNHIHPVLLPWLLAVPSHLGLISFSLAKSRVSFPVVLVQQQLPLYLPLSLSPTFHLSFSICEIASSPSSPPPSPTCNDSGGAENGPLSPPSLSSFYPAANRPIPCHSLSRKRREGGIDLRYYTYDKANRKVNV